MRRPGSKAGFTLVELMVALGVATFSIAIAAEVATVIIRQSQKAREQTNLLGRGRLVVRQLRADLRAAGYGSTGAIAVPFPISPFWVGTFVTTPVGGFSAIPAVFGANATAPGGSDAIQLVVPLVATAQLTTAYIQQGAPAALPIPAALNCPSGVAYATDHTVPTGARSHLMTVDGAGTPQDNWAFTLAAGSEVMCARISTYWVDRVTFPGQPWLRRGDRNFPFAGTIAYADAPGHAMTIPTPVANSLIAPGIENMQIAYRVSSEAYRMAGIGINPALTGWAYDGRAGDFGPNLNVLGGIDQAATARWFEVRIVRINLLARTLRRLDFKSVQAASAAQIGTQATGQETAEDLNVLPVGLTQDMGIEWVTAAEPLMNLRYFDLGLPAGVDAEPF